MWKSWLRAQLLPKSRTNGTEKSLDRVNVQGDVPSPVTRTGFPASIRLGIGMLTENRKQTGLVEGKNVLSNISAASIARVSGHIFIDTLKEWRRNTELIRKLDVRPPNLTSPVEALSGGNQQKILLARWLATNPRVLILDEPTSGVDI